MAKKRCTVLIDGSNFYFKMKELRLHHLLQFDFSSFIKFIAKKYRVVFATYYIGKIKTDGTDKTAQLHASQQKLFAHLRKHKVKYSLGYLLKSGGRFHEKGVDVNIAVDILVATYENLCDHIILISSDTDLLPAIQKARQKGKTVEYIGFSHQPSHAMIANCTESYLLKKELLEPFVRS